MFLIVFTSAWCGFDYSDFDQTQLLSSLLPKCALILISCFVLLIILLLYFNSFPGTNSASNIWGDELFLLLCLCAVLSAGYRHSNLTGICVGCGGGVVFCWFSRYFWHLSHSRRHQCFILPLCASPTDQAVTTHIVMSWVNDDHSW